MVATPPQTDTYNTALDIFDRTHPLRVDVDENLKVTIAGTFPPITGTVTALQGTTPWTVSGTVAATQSGTWTVGLSSGSIDIGKVDQGHAGTESWLVDVTNVVPVTGTFFQAVQPVSGTVTTNQGTSPWVTSVSNFPATVAVTQSTSPWVVSGTITANAGSGTLLVDGSAHTQPISGSVSVSNFPATQPVSGTITANQGTSPWVVSGSITTSPNVNVHDGSGTSIGSTGSSLNVAVSNFPATQPVSGTITANAGTGTFLVDGSAHTQPISASSLPLPTGAATETTISTLNGNVAKEFGTWAYYAGAAGTVIVSAGQRVIGIGCHATSSGSFTINAGTSVPVPANVGVSIEPKGNITAPTIVFTGTDSYFVEVVS